MAKRKKPKPLKLRLPPTNLKGVETGLRRKGFRINPILQGKKSGSKLTFDKPLPDGRRLHGEVYAGRASFKIKHHFDEHDPHRNPIGHLLKDCTKNNRNTISVVPKRKCQTKKKRKPIV